MRRKLACLLVICSFLLVFINPSFNGNFDNGGISTLSSTHGVGAE